MSFISLLFSLSLFSVCLSVCLSVQDVTEICFCIVPRRTRRRAAEPSQVCNACTFGEDGVTLTWNSSSSSNSSKMKEEGASAAEPEKEEVDGE